MPGKQKITKQEIILASGCFLLALLALDWGLGWNQVSRISMPLSLLTEGQWEIDTYAVFTGDKATINGHYYSDKGPLPGMILYPILVLANLILPFSQYSATGQLIYANILGAVFLSTIPFTWSALKVSRLLGPFPLYGVLLFFLGSFLFVFSGVSFSHALAGLLILLAFDRFSQSRYLSAGLLLGASFCTEYTTIIIGLTWALGLLLKGRYRALLKGLVGLLPFILFQAWYNWKITGSPLDFAYKFQESFVMNSENYGFTWPSLKALYHLTVSPYRGILFYAPMLLILLIFNRNLKERKWWLSNRGIGFISTILYILLFSMSRNWYQGWTFGPRYLYPAVVLMFLCLAPGWISVKRNNVLLLLAGCLGVIHTFAAKLTVPFPPTENLYPTFELIIPAFLEGRFYPYNYFIDLGISGYLVFACYLLVLTVMGYFLYQTTRKQTR